MQSPPTPPSDAPLPRASLRQVVGAVCWSFLGVRRGDAMMRDAGAIRPVQVIVVGIVLAALIVVGLITLVHFIIAATTT